MNHFDSLFSLYEEFCRKFRRPRDLHRFFKNPNKYFVFRFLVYLAKFKKIELTDSPGHLRNQINAITDEYKLLCQKVFGDDDSDPLSKIPRNPEIPEEKDNKANIQKDIGRNYTWFANTMLQLIDKSNLYSSSKYSQAYDYRKMLKEKKDTIINSIYKIFTLHLLNNPGLNYVQGNDRICMGIFAISFHFRLLFHLDGDQDIFVSESLSYGIIDELLKMLKCKEYIEQKETHPLYLNIEEFIKKKYNIEFVKMIKHSEFVSMFALKWRIVLFADEVKYPFSIWDYVISEIDKENGIDNAVLAISKAVIDQFMEKRTVTTTIVQSLNQYQNWDPEKIIQIVQSQHESWIYQIYSRYYIFIVLILIIAAISWILFNY